MMPTPSVKRGGVIKNRLFESRDWKEEKMQKKILNHFLVMVIAVFFVFYGGRSMAQNGDDEVPATCTTPGGWTISLLDVYEPGSCMIDGQAVDPCYTWLYQVLGLDGTTKGLNHINFNIPVTMPATLVGQSADEYQATVAVYEAGAGDPTINFGKGILQDYVVKFTPQSTDGIWSFNSNSSRMAAGTGGLKVNNSLEICELAVPGDANYSLMAVSTAQYITTADHKNFRIVEDPYSQCILKAFEILEDGTERELTKGEVGESLKAVGEDYTEDLIYFGVPGQGCSRAVVKADGPNTWYFISGRWIWR